MGSFVVLGGFLAELPRPTAGTAAALAIFAARRPGALAPFAARRPAPGLPGALRRGHGHPFEGVLGQRDLIETGERLRAAGPARGIEDNFLARC